MNNYINIHRVLEGCLLGDGNLRRYKHSSFSYSSSSEQHARYIHYFFKIFCSENYQEIKRNEYFDERTNKTYVCYTFQTKCLPIFTKQYERFYKNGIKKVPLNLKLSKELLLFWYIGDGQLEKKKGFIKIHTDSFKKEEVYFLCNLLIKFEAYLGKKEDYYIIIIPRKNVKQFLEFIGDCPFDDYKYKWNQVAYKNKNIELNGIKYYSKHYPKIEKEYKKGSSIYELHKKYNTPISCIKNYFNRNNINWTPKDKEKPIIQFDLSGERIREWTSAKKIQNELNYSSSAISQCCRGIRKTHKKYIWKFKNS